MCTLTTSTIITNNAAIGQPFSRNQRRISIKSLLYAAKDSSVLPLKEL